ncbi:MAG: hypothetical protein AAFV80_05820 [Bacteroidota bacterium]
MRTAILLLCSLYFLPNLAFSQQNALSAENVEKLNSQVVEFRESNALLESLKASLTEDPNPLRKFPDCKNAFFDRLPGIEEALESTPIELNEVRLDPDWVGNLAMIADEEEALLQALGETEISFWNPGQYLLNIYHQTNKFDAFVERLSGKKAKDLKTEQPEVHTQVKDMFEHIDKSFKKKNVESTLLFEQTTNFENCEVVESGYLQFFGLDYPNIEWRYIKVVSAYCPCGGSVQSFDNRSGKIIVSGAIKSRISSLDPLVLDFSYINHEKTSITEVSCCDDALIITEQDEREKLLLNDREVRSALTAGTKSTSPLIGGNLGVGKDPRGGINIGVNAEFLKPVMPYETLFGRLMVGAEAGVMIKLDKIDEVNFSELIGVIAPEAQMQKEVYKSLSLIYGVKFPLGLGNAKVKVPGQETEVTRLKMYGFQTFAGFNIRVNKFNIQGTLPLVSVFNYVYTPQDGSGESINDSDFHFLLNQNNLFQLGVLVPIP